jgi:hypothetical protein
LITFLVRDPCNSISLLLVSLSVFFQEARKKINKCLAILLTIEQAVRCDSHHFRLFIEWHAHVNINILFSKPLLKVRDVLNIDKDGDMSSMLLFIP